MISFLWAKNSSVWPSTKGIVLKKEPPRARFVLSLARAWSIHWIQAGEDPETGLESSSEIVAVAAFVHLI